MKQFMKTVFWSMLMVLAFGLSFTSCSSDDDEGGADGVKTCYVKVDGKQTNLSYAYYYGDEDGEVLVFTNVDMLYYYQNPQKISKGLIMKTVALFTPDKFSTGTITGYGGFQYEEVDMYAQMYEDSEEFSAYISEDEESSPINFTVDNGYYKIDAKSIKVEVWNEDSMLRRTTVDFYFEGTMQDGSIFYEDDVYAAKVDEPTMQWIKSMCAN